MAFGVGVRHKQRQGGGRRGEFSPSRPAPYPALPLPSPMSMSVWVPSWSMKLEEDWGECKIWPLG